MTAPLRGVEPNTFLPTTPPVPAVATTAVSDVVMADLSGKQERLAPASSAPSTEEAIAELSLAMARGLHLVEEKQEQLATDTKAWITSFESKLNQLTTAFAQAAPKPTARGDSSARKAGVPLAGGAVVPVASTQAAQASVAGATPAGPTAQVKCAALTLKRGCKRCTRDSALQCVVNGKARGFCTQHEGMMKDGTLEKIQDEDGHPIEVQRVGGVRGQGVVQVGV